MLKLFAFGLVLSAALHMAAMYQGSRFGRAVCAEAFGLCNHSKWILLAFVALALVAMMAKRSTS